MKTSVSLLAAFISASALNAADVPVDANIDQDTVWYSDNTYILDGFIYVTDGATLTIEPGTVIKAEDGQSANASALIIARGSKIYAVGTPSDPIIFTSIHDPLDGTLDDSNTGLWGGVVILGDGLLNSDKFQKGQIYPNITDNVEGIEVSELTQFGGTSNDNGQGLFRYVSIRHGGTVLDPDNELNGLTLGGVTDKTTVEFVEVFANTDDGIEFFGGNVNTRFMLMSFGNDDSFDWDSGWTGYGQFWASVGNSDHAGELDGRVFNGENQVDELRGMGTIYNATFVGPGSDAGTAEEVFEISDDAGVRYYNSIFTGFDGPAMDLKGDAEAGITELADGKPRVDFTNNIWFDLSAGTTPAELVPNANGQVLFSDASRLNEIEDPKLRGVGLDFDGSFDPRPDYDSPAVLGHSESNALAALPAGNDWFIQTDFQGAFSPDTNWAYGWTYTYSKGYFPEANGAAAASPVNISMRTDVAAGSSISASFVIEGELPKAVLIRAVGPKLPDFGATETPMADPQFTLYNVKDGAIAEVAASDDWAGQDDADAIEVIADYLGATSLRPFDGGSIDDTTSAAVYVVLNPGVYSAVVSDATGAAGNVLVEVYDADL